MSIMLDLPPAMTQEVQGYATLAGTSLEQVLLECLSAELKRRHETDRVMHELDALVEKTSSRRHGAPYVFNRSDAYNEGEYA